MFFPLDLIFSTFSASPKSAILLVSNSNSHLLLFDHLLFNSAVCPDPGEPSKGKRLNDNFQEGETVAFECNKNHDLVGNDTIRCEGGAWSGGLPKCKGDNN